jgi:hypothetical protein
MVDHQPTYCFFYDKLYGDFPDRLLFEPLCGISRNICPKEQTVIPILYGRFGMYLPKLYFSKGFCGWTRLECHACKDCDHLFCGDIQLHKPKKLHF